MIDTALLVVRLVVGALFVGHGAQKLFGWFGGYGVAGTGGWLEQMGYRRGRAFAAVAGAAELGGGLLLATGLLTPLAAAGIIGMMVSAILAVHLEKGPWVTEGGFEYTLVLATIAFALALTGPGRYSLDRAFGWSGGGWEWGLGALLIGTLSAVALEGARRSRLRTVAAPEQAEERRAA